MEYWGSFETFEDRNEFKLTAISSEPYWAYTGELENGAFKYEMPAYIKKAGKVYKLK